MPTAKVAALFVGRPVTVGTPGATDPMDREWTTGFFKRPAPGPVALGVPGLDGDGVADPVNHGGPDKAVCAYPAAHYPGWAAELAVVDFAFGAFGENVTVAGLSEADVCVGDVFAVGSAVVQVSQPRQPCWKLARRWRVKALTARVVESGKTGWYFRVLTPGTVAAGDALTRTARPHPEWPVTAANAVLHHRKADRAAAAALAACPALSASWVETLARRAAG